jgi:Mrp family chromosome partitioning ATPase
MTPAEMVQLASEEETKIVEGVFLQSAAGRKTAVFTAPDRFSGCSWLSAGVARTLAERVPGASVCVVDANLRWPSLHKLFCIDNTRGLIQALKEVDPIRDYTRRMHDTNLWVLPSGGTVDESHSIFVSGRVKTRFEELKRQFDFVLIDTVAMKASPDAAILGPLTDGAVLVLAANSTSRSGAMNIKFTLDAACVPIAGAILNKRTYPIPDQIYRYL